MAVTARELEERAYRKKRAKRRVSDRRARDAKKNPRRPVRPRSRKPSPVSRLRKSLSISLRSVQIVGSILLIFAVAIGVVGGRAAIADRGYELNRLRAELQEAKAQTDSLESRVATLQNPDRIAAAAHAMGMEPVNSASSGFNDALIASQSPGAVSTSTMPAESPVELREFPGISSSRPAPSRIVLELEATTEPPLQFAGLREWGGMVLRWLKGSTPIEAHN